MSQMSVCVAVTVLLLGSAGPVLGQGGSAQPISEEARALWAKSLELKRAGDVRNGLDYFLRAYQTDARILGFDDEGLLESAIEQLGQDLEARPDDVDLRFKMAEATNIKGYIEESLTHYQKVVEKAPDSPQAAIARDEILRLQALIQARTRQEAQADADPGGYPSDAGQEDPRLPRDPGDVFLPRGETGGGSGEGDGKSPELQAADEKIMSLEKELQGQKEEMEKLKKEHSALQKKYDELSKKAEKWYFYYTRFFADPRNVEQLQQGR